MQDGKTVRLSAGGGGGCGAWPGPGAAGIWALSSLWQLPHKLRPFFPHHPEDSGCAVCGPPPVRAPLASLRVSPSHSRGLLQACSSSVPKSKSIFSQLLRQKLRTATQQPSLASCLAAGLLCCPNPLTFTHHLVMSPCCSAPVCPHINHMILRTDWTPLPPTYPALCAPPEVSLHSAPSFCHHLELTPFFGPCTKRPTSSTFQSISSCQFFQTHSPKPHFPHA